MDNVCIVTDATQKILEYIQEISAFCKVGLVEEEAGALILLKQVLRKRGYVVSACNKADTNIEGVHILILCGNEKFVTKQLDCSQQKNIKVIIYVSALPSVLLFQMADKIKAKVLIEQSLLEARYNSLNSLICEYASCAMLLFDIFCFYSDKELLTIADKTDKIAYSLINISTTNFLNIAIDLLFLKQSIGKAYITCKSIDTEDKPEYTFLLTGYIWEIYGSFINRYNANTLDLLIPECALTNLENKLNSQFDKNLQHMKKVIYANRKNYKLLFSILEKNAEFIEAHNQIADSSRLMQNILSYAKRSDNLLSYIYTKGYLT